MVKKSLNQLNAKQLKAILKFYNFSPPDTVVDVAKLLQLLHYCDGYTAVFKDMPSENILANLSASGSLQQLFSKDGKVIVNCKQVPSSSNCTSCKKEVLGDSSLQGQGLECNNCEGWFHNQCHSFPMSFKLYGLLATSPHFLKALCPLCVEFNLNSQHKLYTEIQHLKTEFSGIKEAFKSELSEIKQALKLEQLKDHIELVLDKDTVQAYCTDLHNEVATITSSTKEMKTSLGNTLMSVNNVTDQIVESVQKIEKLDMDVLSSNITGLSQNVSDLSVQIDKSVEKLSSEKLSFTNSSLNMPNLNISNTNTNSIDESAKKVYKNPASYTYSSSTSPTLEPSLYSNAVQKPPHKLPATNPSKKPETSARPSPKLLCDESKTVAIENILNYNKFIKHAKDTKKEFNTYHPGVKIIHSKGTRRGTLLIELDKEDDAISIVENWNSKCFSNDDGTNNKTTATLLKDKNCKGILYNIDHEFTDEFIANEFKKANLKMDVTVRRFMKGNKKMSTVMITFGCKEDLEQALSNGVTVGPSPEDVHLYKPTPSVVQCFNCFKFDHTKVWCPKRIKCCQFCTQDHDAKDCLIHKDENKSQYKCVNCDEGNHGSLSKDCRAYKDKLAQALQYSQL